MDNASLTRDQRLSETRSHQVFARAASVAEHHHDTANPDKPLWLMVPAGAVALFALLGIIWTGYQLWVATPALSGDVAIPKLLVLLVVYFTSLFGFSYGYELYDVWKALRLTVIIGVIGLAAVFILLALGAVLKGSSSSSKSSSSSSSKSSDSGSGSAPALAFGSSAPPTNTSSGSPISLNLGRTFYSSRPYSGSAGSGIALDPSTPPGCCSFCTRPLPSGGAIVVPAGADPALFCPKCGQKFEAAGENANRAGTA
jgi:hypothetical protein